ncbi:hypothetical protein GGX14DRAFT_408567 [Mycena pura]|uniref:Uncharacterized protein n=1 Tax=Mycena pura TaxID=153505 RepID=A0AAD6UL06_9AGAR|nr:hypothetical protein GGX14DRAFT_408567 [Mycena pura]
MPGCRGGRPVRKGNGGPQTEASRNQSISSKTGVGGWVSKFVEVELEERFEDTALSVRRQVDGQAAVLIRSCQGEPISAAGSGTLISGSSCLGFQMIKNYFYIRWSVSTGFGVSRCVNPYGDACSESLCGLSAAC